MPRVSTKTAIKCALVFYGMLILALSSSRNFKTPRDIKQSFDTRPPTAAGKSKLFDVPIYRSHDVNCTVRDRFLDSNKLRDAYDGNDRTNSTDYMTMYARSLRSATIINPHRFNILQEPIEPCDHDILLLVYIHSAPRNKEKRRVIRETWGNSNVTVDAKNGKMAVLLKKNLMFVMGVPLNETEAKIAQEEAGLHGDVLQEDYIDSYSNITYKAISALKYVKYNCMHVPFILKSDDDVFIHMFNLLRRLFHVLTNPHPANPPSASTAKELTVYGLEKPTNYLNCLLWTRMVPLRNRKSKWYVSEHQWKSKVFPNYCSGCAYLMTPDVAARLYEASLYTPFFWVDDVYITGLLPIRMNFEPAQLYRSYRLSCTDMDKELLGAHGDLETYLFSHCPKGYSNLWEVTLIIEKLWQTPSYAD